MTQKNIKQHIYHLSTVIGNRNYIDYDNLERTAEYIKQLFFKIGYAPFEQTYEVSSQTFRNIIAVKEGKRKEEIIIIAAHYDTCFNPGADDNASGIAGLLELANNLKDEELNYTLKFIAFTNEEPPFFHTSQRGSRVYVRRARKEKEKIKGALILESIGYYTEIPNSQSYPPGLGLFYPSKGNFLAVVSDFSSSSLLKIIVASFKKHSAFPIEHLIAPRFITGVDFSDHSSFWEKGYKAVMITDTAFYRYKYYHTQDDTYEKLNYSALAEVIKALTKVVIDLGNT